MVLISQPVRVSVSESRLVISTPFAVISVLTAYALLVLTGIAMVVHPDPALSGKIVGLALITIGTTYIAVLQNGRVQFDIDAVITRSEFQRRRYDLNSIAKIAIAERGTLVPQFGLVGIRTDGSLLQLEMVQVFALRTSSCAVRRLERACGMANQWLEDHRTIRVVHDEDG